MDKYGQYWSPPKGVVFPYLDLEGFLPDPKGEKYPSYLAIDEEVFREWGEKISNHKVENSEHQELTIVRYPPVHFADLNNKEFPGRDCPKGGAIYCPASQDEDEVLAALNQEMWRLKKLFPFLRINVVNKQQSQDSEPVQTRSPSGRPARSRSTSHGSPGTTGWSGAPANAPPGRRAQPITKIS